MKKLILILSIFAGVSLIADDPSWFRASDVSQKCQGSNCPNVAAE